MKRCRVVALGLALAALFGCRQESSSPGGKPPIILISIDTLRADRLPAYGYRKVATPAIDELRQDGLLAASAWSHYPLTLPSHVSILSGLLPPDHGVRDNVGYSFDPARHPYLPRLLHQAGYATGAAVSSWVLRGSTGLSDGFDFYDDHLERRPDQTLDTIERPGMATVAAAMAFVRERFSSGRLDQPFFLFVHLYEPHFPHTAPEPFASRYADPYDGEVATADAAVGELLARLKELGLYERALILLVSDHGEGLGDHGETQHGIFLYRPMLEVPLLLKLPGGAHRGGTLPGVTELVDVAPTILAAAGIARPPALPGAPLLERLAAGPAAPERAVYSETWYPRLHLGWSELASLRQGALHTIDGPSPELFDVARDPAESRNLLAENRRAYGEARQEIARHKTPLAPPGAIDAEAAKKLAALGYLAGGSVLAKGALPDPRDRRPTLRQLEDGFAAAAAGRHEEAVRLYRQALTSDPQMVDIQAFLGASLLKLGRPGEALAAYEKALELSGGAPHLALATAGVLLALGRNDEAARHAELARKTDPTKAFEILGRAALAKGDLSGAAAVARQAAVAGQASEGLRREVGQALAEKGRADEAVALLQPAGASGAAAAPPSAETRNAYARALSDAGRQEEALAELDKVVAEEPGNARTHELLGVVTLKLDRPGDARRHLERALALDARRPAAWNTLGVALFQLGDPANALAAWHKAIALDPEQFDALFNVGLVAANAGRTGEAKDALRQFLKTAPADRFATERQKAQAVLKGIGG